MLREPQGYHSLECCRIKMKQIVLSFSARGLARAGEAPASHQSERRWQWTRKLGCRCYCSPLGSGESLSLSSKRGEDHIFILETKKCSQGR